MEMELLRREGLGHMGNLLIKFAPNVAKTPRNPSMSELSALRRKAVASRYRRRRQGLNTFKQLSLRLGRALPLGVASAIINPYVLLSKCKNGTLRDIS